MPKATATEESAYPIPEDLPLPLQLQKVELFTHPYVDKKGRDQIFRKWEWDFVVTEGDYAGLTVRGNSEPKITNLTEPTGSLSLARPWVEALLSRDIDLGEEIDTDDLLGLSAVGTVRHLEPRAKKEGPGYWYNVELDELFPAAPTNGTVRAQNPWDAANAGEPPY